MGSLEVDKWNHIKCVPPILWVYPLAIKHGNGTFPYIPQYRRCVLFPLSSFPFGDFNTSHVWWHRRVYPNCYPVNINAMNVHLINISPMSYSAGIYNSQRQLEILSHLSQVLSHLSPLHPKYYPNNYTTVYPNNINLNIYIFPNISRLVINMNPIRTWISYIYSIYIIYIYILYNIYII
jgi:hypothetical protein